MKNWVKIRREELEEEGTGDSGTETDWTQAGTISELN